MKLRCPSCNFEWDVESWPGDSVNCPSCNWTNILPQAATVQYSETPVPELSPHGDLPQEKVLPPGTKLGTYEITGFLGKGGMGTVYRAQHTMLDRTVALKVLPERLMQDEEFIGRFKREAMSLAKLSHPGIVAIHDMGFEGRTYYLVMEYIDGLSLRELIGKEKMEPEAAIKLVPQLCEAMEYAHSQGIIHRDIKPENILVTREGQAKIADFGLAKMLNGDRKRPALTETNIVMGTLDYMAPEQRDSLKSVDHRADIYSLGVVLYELLTGELPVGKFDAPSKQVQVDVRLDEVVLRALENNPEKRYQRASHMGTDVKTVHTSKGEGPPPVTYEKPIAPSGDWKFGDIFRDASAVFWKDNNWLILAGAAFLTSILSGFTALILAGPMFGGMYSLCLKALRHPQRKVNFGDVFDGFDKFGPLLGMFWLFVLGMIGGLICFLVGAIIFSTFWTFIYLVKMDQDLPVTRCFGESWRMVRRAGFWKHILLGLLFIALNSVSAVPFVGWIINALVAPFVWLATTSAYLRLKAPSSGN